MAKLNTKNSTDGILSWDKSEIIPQKVYLRRTLLDLINRFPKNQINILTEIDALEKAFGKPVYSILLKLLTQLDFKENQAEQIWQKIVSHWRSMEKGLDRSVNLITAACDFLLSEKIYFNHPKLVELSEFEKTQQNSRNDSLTGLFNRSSFEEILKVELSRAKRYETDFSIVFFDLDDFKTINDLYGHLAGDEVLRKVANEIKRNKRGEDTAARYGGEELVLILPETSKQKALVLAQRFRQNIENLKFNFGNQQVGITVSCGIATFPLDALTSIELLDCADKALYMAKALGKNRAKLYSKEMRNSNRFSCSGKVEIHPLRFSSTNNYLETNLINISQSGLLVESTTVISKGTKVKLSLSIPALETSLNLMGSVTRVESYIKAYKIGISFFTLSFKEKENITQTISSIFN